MHKHRQLNGQSLNLYLSIRPGMDVFNDMNQYVGVLAYMEPTYLIPVACQA